MGYYTFLPSGEIVDGRLIYYNNYPETSDGIPATFHVIQEKNQYKIKWFYRATDKVYEDVAKFYWKVWVGYWDLSLPAPFKYFSLFSVLPLKMKTEDVVAALTKKFF